MVPLAEAGVFGWLLGLFSFKLVSCLALAGAIFAIGAWGVLARRNVLVMLISVELMLNAVMLTFVSFSRALVNMGPQLSNPYAAEGGQIFALFIIAIAAAEAAVGLAIVISYFRNRQTVDTREIRAMKN
ncbi:MAG: NADH-quinone oxidoreductase subunit NuoK [Planctomycetota bacterium]|nr:NADH-quinone oxidoreductase subunit NuoK [Planctomycetota bacterium]